MLEKYFLELSLNGTGTYTRSADGTYRGTSNGLGRLFGATHAAVLRVINSSHAKNAKRVHALAMLAYYSDKSAREDFDTARQFAAACEQAYVERNNTFRLAFNEDQPRAENGQWGEGGGGDTKDSGSDKNIVASNAHIEKLGYSIVKGLPFDFQKATAMYSVKQPDGSTKAMSSKEIKALVKQSKKGLKLSNEDQPRAENGQWGEGITETGEKIGGSTGAKVVTRGENKYVMKEYSGRADQAKNEYVANKLYNEFGNNAGAPNSEMHGDAVLNPFVEKLEFGNVDSATASENFVADAWLANWDVVGMGADNIAQDPNGNVHRIDNGGALLYRAQGGLKGEAFGAKVGELNTFRDKSINPDAARIFKSVDDKAISSQIKELSGKYNRERMAAIVRSGKLDTATTEKLINTLDARMQYLRGLTDLKLSLSESEPMLGKYFTELQQAQRAISFAFAEALCLSFNPDQERDPDGKFASGGGSGESKGDNASVTRAVARLSQPTAHVNSNNINGAAKVQWDNMSKSERAGFKDANEFAEHVENKWSEGKVLDAIKGGGKDLNTIASDTKIPMSKYGDARPQDAKLNATVVRLIAQGKVEASNPRFGSPVISLKK